MTAASVEAPAGPTQARRTQAERTASTRALLLDATYDCLAEMGYAETTTTEVAKRAGVSRGALLHHFPTKTDLVLAAHAHVLARRYAEFVSVFAELPEDERSQTTALALLWDMYRRPTFAAWLELAVAARTNAELHDRFVEIERRFMHSIEAEAVAIYPAADAAWTRISTLFAFALLDGLALSRAVGVGDAADADEIVEMLKTLATMFNPPTGGA